MNTYHRLPACILALVGIAVFLRGEKSPIEKRHGDAGALYPNSMSEAEWTLVPGIGPRTAQVIFAASASGSFDSMVGEELEAAMLRVPGVGPETIRAARELVVFDVSTAQEIDVQ